MHPGRNGQETETFLQFCFFIFIFCAFSFKTAYIVARAGNRKTLLLSVARNRPHPCCP